MHVGIEYPLLLAVGLASMGLAALLASRARRRRRAVIEYMGGRESRLVAAIVVLRLAGILMASLAASGLYVVEERWVPVEDVGGEALAGLPAIHVVMVDDSKSMGRLVGEARSFVAMYLGSLGPGDYVEVYRFYEVVEPVCRAGEPGLCLGNLSMITGSSRYTALGTAIGFLGSIRQASSLPVVAVIVSDGANNMGPDPVEVARRLSGAEDLAVALVKVGDDPRSVLEEVSSAAGWPLYEVGSGAPERVLEDLAGDIYREAKARALSVNGMIRLEDKDYTPSVALALAALVALALSKVAGP